jgi:NADH-quinone oxidoreductase subunit J
VGAISILVIFAIMLTREVQQGNLPNRLQPAAVVLPALLLVAFISTFLRTDWDSRLLPASLPPALQEVLTNTPTWLASLLVREYVLPFEMVSVLLLAAIIGALALVRER